MEVKKWIKNTFIGWLVGFVLIVVLALIFETAGMADTQLFIGLGMGLSVGFFQFRYLRKLLKISNLWIWYSAIGLALPFFLLEFTPEDGPLAQMTYSLLWIIPFGGLIVGLLQFQLLKKKVNKPLLWIPTCVVGWSLGVTFAIISELNILPKMTGILGGIITLLIMLSGGVLLGFFQGKVLCKLISNE